MSGVRARSSSANAVRYSARSAWVILGHGPLSNASRAAPTAAAMSSFCASATVK